jgi:hypothetical protein
VRRIPFHQFLYPQGTHCKHKETQQCCREDEHEEEWIVTLQQTEAQNKEGNGGMILIVVVKEVHLSCIKYLLKCSEKYSADFTL